MVSFDAFPGQYNKSGRKKTNSSSWKRRQKTKNGSLPTRKLKKQETVLLFFGFTSTLWRFNFRPFETFNFCFTSPGCCFKKSHLLGRFNFNFNQPTNLDPKNQANLDATKSVETRKTKVATVCPMKRIGGVQKHRNCMTSYWSQVKNPLGVSWSLLFLLSLIQKKNHRLHHLSQVKGNIQTPNLSLGNFPPPPRTPFHLTARAGPMSDGMARVLWFFFNEKTSRAVVSSFGDFLRWGWSVDIMSEVWKLWEEARNKIWKGDT